MHVHCSLQLHNEKIKLFYTCEICKYMYLCPIYVAKSHGGKFCDHAICHTQTSPLLYAIKESALGDDCTFPTACGKFRFQWDHFLNLHHLER